MVATDPVQFPQWRTVHHLARLLRREVLDSMRLHRLMAPAFSLVSLPPGVRLSRGGRSRLLFFRFRRRHK
jgi:hypothetical protein